MFETYEREARRAESVRNLDAENQITRFGAGATFEVGQVADLLAIRKALIVVDPGLMASEGAKLVETVLRRANILTVPFVHISSTPLASQAEEAAETARKAHCDGVVSYGGGSVLDVAKAASILEEGHGVHDYGHGREARPQMPHIALPTTAGTGAESSPYGFYVQEKGHEHTVVEGEALIPDAAVIDPLSHLSMPAALTAASGLNALADAIEALVTKARTEASDQDARQAISLIVENLPLAVQDGKDLEARTQMALASFLAGRAFRVAGLGVVDSISLVLSSLFSIGQSEANAIILPHLVQTQIERDPDRFAALAGAFPGVSKAGDLPAALRGFQASVGLRKNLHDLGLGWEDIYLCAHAILAHPFNVRDPDGLDAADLSDILAGALEVQA